MKSTKLIPVLLAGGIGSRLWPLSREHYPKQLLTLLGDDSLLQATIRRVLQCADLDSFIVICNEEHRFEVLTQIAQLKPDCDFKILLEPVGRNTAAAAALAAFYAPENSHLLFLPADHILKPDTEFVRQIAVANQAASENKLITFGIQPTYAEIGYGYIKSGTEISSDIYHIDKFVEKPKQDVAESFISEGDYFWNSGMFLFPKALFLQELKTHSLAIYTSVQKACQEFFPDGHFVRVEPEQFAQTPSDSLDYAVMEHTKQAVMLKLDIQWSDIGSWQSLYEYEEKDQNGNVMFGDVVSIDNKNCLLRSDSRLLAAVGLEDIIAVSTGDCILISSKKESQRVKDVVKTLQLNKREEGMRHLHQYHPWGSTELLNVAENFRIKRVDIEPKQCMSLHEHQQTTESWLVIIGMVEVQIGNEKSTYYKGEAFFIAQASQHRLCNPTSELLSLVKVQSGDNFNEQDIIRYD